MDLRERVVGAISQDMSRRAAAVRFGVSAASTVRWAALQRDQGKPAAKPQGGDTCSARAEAACITTYNRYTAPRPDPKRPASVSLRLMAGPSTSEDDASVTLQRQIAKIVAGLIVEEKRSYQTHLRELEEQAERERIAPERRRHDRLRKANAYGVVALVESGSLLAPGHGDEDAEANSSAAIKIQPKSLKPLFNYKSNLKEILPLSRKAAHL